MNTRIGIVTSDLSAEQAESLFAAVQEALRTTLAENGYGSGNVRLETRTFEDGARTDTRKNQRVSSFNPSAYETEDEVDAAEYVTQDEVAGTGFLKKVFGS